MCLSGIILVSVINEVYTFSHKQTEKGIEHCSKLDEAQYLEVHRSWITIWRSLLFFCFDLYNFICCVLYGNVLFVFISVHQCADCFYNFLETLNLFTVN